ncbi:MAG: flagellar basal body-associated FliL family protein [Deltaproteobacteria bacterium]|nr:flagellar basal body-associated FliL family protein [Deltaproteobacteria bacterium]
MAEDASTSSTENSQDGVIDLENLVRDIDSVDTAGPVEQGSRLASSEPIREPAKPEATMPSPKIKTESKVEVSGVSEDELDAVLMLESPELAIEMAAIRDVAKSAGQSESPSALDGDSSIAGVNARLTLRQRLGFQVLKMVSAGRQAKEFSKRAVNDSKGLFRELLIQTKVSAIDSFHGRKAQVAAGFSWFKSRTWQQRFSILLAFAVLGALILVVAKFSQGKLLPKTEREWIASFEEKADGVFTYERNDPFEDFNDPILHPEYVVVIERVIVNLARTPEAEEGSNPMAAFEFYIQTDNQESAIEVKDRNIEVRDVLARAVERMTYPELATEEGKQKLKLVLRKDLNLIMTKGRVRRVFLKTIVLNPE